MPTFELPDDLAEYLEDRAKKNGQSAEEFLTRIVYDRREKDRKLQGIDNIAPKSYLKRNSVAARRQTASTISRLAHHHRAKLLENSVN